MKIDMTSAFHNDYLRYTSEGLSGGKSRVRLVNQEKKHGRTSLWRGQTLTPFHLGLCVEPVPPIDPEWMLISAFVSIPKTGSKEGQLSLGGAHVRTADIDPLT